MGLNVTTQLTAFFITIFYYCPFLTNIVKHVGKETKFHFLSTGCKVASEHRAAFRRFFALAGHVGSAQFKLLYLASVLIKCYCSTFSYKIKLRICEIYTFTHSKFVFI